MDSQPTIIHVDSDGNPLSIPTQTEQVPQIPQVTQHVDTDGNVIGLNGKLLQGPPPGQGPDIGNVMPTGQQIGTFVANAFPLLSATATSETGPLGSMLGAAGGQQVANILKSYAPQYFSENGKAPGLGEQLSSDAQAAGTEGTARLLGATIPGLSSFSGALRSPSAEEIQAQKLKDLMAKSRENSNQGRALKSVLSKGMRGDSIQDTDKIRDELDAFVNDPTRARSTTMDIYGRQSIQELIPKETQDNLKQILDATDKLKKSPSGDSPITWENGKYLLKYGTGVALDSVLGTGHPYLMGAAALGSIELTQNALSKIAQSPMLTKAMTGLMNSSTSPGVAKLYQQALLTGLRGESMYMTGSDGKREKVTISDQGEPQLPKNPTNAPSGQSSPHVPMNQADTPSLVSNIEREFTSPDAMGRFTRTPIYFDKADLKNDQEYMQQKGLSKLPYKEVTGEYYHRPKSEIVVHPTTTGSYGEMNRVMGHEQIHALLDANKNPEPPNPNISTKDPAFPLLGRALQSWNESGRAGNPKLELPAYMGAYEPGQLQGISEKDASDWIDQYIQKLPGPAQATLRKIQQSIVASRQWE